MRHSSKLAIAIAAIATTLLGIAASAASARNITIVNSAVGWKVMMRPLTIIEGGNEIRCAFIMEGPWLVHEFEKRSGTRLAWVGRARVGTCERGRMIIRRETLPWERLYRGFNGILPNITGLIIQTIGAGIDTEINGLECSVTTTAERPAIEIMLVTSGEITGDEVEREARISTGGGTLCTLAGESSLSGTAESITVEGGSEHTKLRLI